MQPIAGFIGELVALGLSSGRWLCDRGGLTGRRIGPRPVSEPDPAGRILEGARRARLGFERFAQGRVVRCRSATLAAGAFSARTISNMIPSSERASGSSA
jgi:hypothetical protein